MSIETRNVKEIDFSVPQHLKGIEEYKNNLVHYYDYVYTDDSYYNEMETFAESFYDSFLINSNVWLFTHSFLMTLSKLNEVKDYDFRLKQNGINSNCEQSNVMLEGKLLKTVLLHPHDKKEILNIISYMVDGGNSRSLLIVNNAPGGLDGDNLQSDRYFHLTKNRHGDIRDILFNLKELTAFCKVNSSSIFLPYGGFDFGSFIFFEIKA